MVPRRGARLFSDFAFVEFERDFDFRLVLAIAFFQLDCLVDDGHPHEILESLFGPIDCVIDGFSEVLGAPADEHDFLEYHDM